MLEALIIGIVVVISTMALARHVGREITPGAGDCSDCSERCSAHTTCPIASVKEHYRHRRTGDDAHPSDTRR